MVRWLPIVTAVLLGALIGIGAFTFVYAKGYSYLSTDSGACANCHIMNEHFAAWLKSSHRAVAGCNDCHAPHDLLGKYATKARNGFWHSFYFTTGTFAYPLRITERNHEVTEHACRGCHSSMTDMVDHAATLERAGVTAATSTRRAEPLACTRCHRNVGHWVR
jgi:cytochrome c nitrite reductase small subunit